MGILRWILLILGVCFIFGGVRIGDSVYGLGCGGCKPVAIVRKG